MLTFIWFFLRWAGRLRHYFSLLRTRSIFFCTKAKEVFFSILHLRRWVKVVTPFKSFNEVFLLEGSAFPYSDFLAVALKLSENTSVIVNVSDLFTQSLLEAVRGDGESL